MASEPIQMAAPADVYRQRRRQLATRLTRPFVIYAGHAPARSYASNPHRFRAACSYLYFGGVPLEHAALLIEPASDGDAGCHLLRVPEGPDDALWLGESPDDRAIAAASGIDPTRIVDVDRLKLLLGSRTAGALVAPHAQTLAQARAVGVDDATDDEKLAVIEQRLIKDEHELKAMRRAAEAAVAAFKSAAAATQPGAIENDVQAALEGEFIRRSCVPSFSTICTVRGEVLHGAAASRPLADGALLLLDAGAEEVTGYTSDITRTWPVGGAWRGLQKALYETVLRAQQAAVAACVPGRRYREIHELAARTICAGLVDAGLFRGNPDELADRGAYGLLFAHGVGHLLGLGVHDLEEFGDLAGYAAGRRRPARFGDCFLRLDRDLAPGMTVTIEPGVYFVPAIWARQDMVAPFADAINRDKIDELLASGFGGIRIEDDVHVRPASAPGPEVLTAALPKSAEEIAALVSQTEPRP
ncbi:MAG: aminopeptidase P N-terminal domain-containing protein [Phycisphaerales bacterium]|nr:aminopeptidase P N-terminal domain-containing protein [Phycisphaerales bacterium]